MEIVGEGSIGDKARQLYEKTPTLEDIGFYAPDRTVIAESVLDGYLRHNGFGDSLSEVEITPGIEDRIRNGQLSQQEYKILAGTRKRFEGRPLAIRSSAQGDARGTGIYRSNFCQNDPASLRKGFLDVLASYFSPDAVAFRQDAGLGSGFGIMFEPLIYQDTDWALAPLYSGYGYTSTSRGEGYINIVPGLLGGVSTKGGIKFHRSCVDEYANFADFIEAIGESERGPMVLDRFIGNRSGHAFVTYNGKVMPCHLDLDDDMRFKVMEMTFDDLFQMMEEMERAFGCPQYFEFAMTLDDEPVFWITQIADASKKLDVMDFEEGNILMEAHMVTGTGVKTCHKIADCMNPSDRLPLDNFNRENEGYVLMYSARLMSKGIEGAYRLMYSQFNRAGVLIEVQDGSHLGEDPVSHLRGKVDMTGKFIGALEREFPEPNWKAIHAREVEEHKDGHDNGIRVYQGTVQVVSSEKQDRMQVIALD